MSYKPLLLSEQAINSGEVLASGEAFYSDFNTQVPTLDSGINSSYDSSLSGLLYLEKPDNKTLDSNGINDSAFAHIFGFSNFSSANLAEKNTVNLSVFKPYIHYYPRFSTGALLSYSLSTEVKYFPIDYSLTFSQSPYNNSYFPTLYNFSGQLDASGNPIFTNNKLIPPG
jgi:hypothetical protein